MLSLSDLLDHFKLDAEIGPNFTSHVSYRPNRARGLRKERHETRWLRTKRIGGGMFGAVWLEEHGEDNMKEQRAVKVINKARMQDFRIDYERGIVALAEFSKSQHWQEDVFVAFFGWFDDPDNVYLAMEYLALGDLSQYIFTAISEEETKQIASDLLQGLKIMHAEGFTHRDLKPQNVFVVQKPPVSPTWWVKIGDFGIAKRVKNAQTALRTGIGTPHYQAPEILYLDEYAESSSYNSLVDIWSLGCVLYKIITQEVPFPSASITMRFCNGERPFDVTSLSKKVSPHGTTFIAGLLKPLPQERPTATDALRSPWLQSMEKPLDAAIQVAHRSEKKLLMESKPGTLANRSGDSEDSEEQSIRRFFSASFLQAAREEDIELLKILMHKVDVNVKDPQGFTALHLCAQKGNLEAMQLLIELGAGLEAFDAHGQTPLYYSMLNDYEEATRYLIRKGANVNTQPTPVRLRLVRTVRELAEEKREDEKGEEEPGEGSDLHGRSERSMDELEPPSMPKIKDLAKKVSSSDLSNSSHSISSRDLDISVHSNGKEHRQTESCDLEKDPGPYSTPATLEATQSNQRHYCRAEGCSHTKGFARVPDLKRHQKIHRGDTPIWYCGCCKNVATTGTKAHLGSTI
ncbi:Ankyrin-2 [Lobaria immixta]|nr:Ankyrin-2 [Lobaria immixta]